MTERESPVNHRRGHRRRRSQSFDAQLPAWPSDPEHVEAGKIDFEAIAHVLANTCRWGGRTRRFLSFAQHAVTASEEVVALDGIAEEDRRALALHALLTNARAAWLGDEDGANAVSTRAAARTRTHGEKVDTAVREAAGLDPKLSEEWSEVSRFVALMTESAEGATSGWAEPASSSRRCAAPSGRSHPRPPQDVGSPGSGSWPAFLLPMPATSAPGAARPTPRPPP